MNIFTFILCRLFIIDSDIFVYVQSWRAWSVRRYCRAGTASYYTCDLLHPSTFHAIHNQKTAAYTCSSESNILTSTFGEKQGHVTATRPLFLAENAVNSLEVAVRCCKHEAPYIRFLNCDHHLNLDVCTHATTISCTPTLFSGL